MKKKSNLEKVDYKLGKDEKIAIDQGLKSIEKGDVKPNEEIKRITKDKYPHLSG